MASNQNIEDTIKEINKLQSKDFQFELTDVMNNKQVEKQTTEKVYYASEHPFLNSEDPEFNWELINESRGSLRIVRKDNNALVALVMDELPHLKKEESIAIANLIIAAPELFRALVFCKNVIEANGIYEASERIAFESAKNAILKATK